jgi:hypothetical protein
MVAIALPMPVYIAAGVGFTTCNRVCGGLSASAIHHPTLSPITSYLQQIDGIHDRVLLDRISAITVLIHISRSIMLTAIPAKAPAAIFAASEKFGGRDSYLSTSSASPPSHPNSKACPTRILPAQPEESLDPPQPFPCPLGADGSLPQSRCCSLRTWAVPPKSKKPNKTKCTQQTMRPSLCAQQTVAEDKRP